MPRLLRHLALLWLALVLASVAALISLSPQNKIESDILALLPDDATPQIPAEELQPLTRRINNQLLFLVSSAPGDTTAQTADYYLAELQKIPGLQAVEGPVTPGQQTAYGKFFFDHRAQNIDPSTLEKLAHPEKFSRQILAQIYSPFAGISSAEIKNDPLLLTRALQLSSAQNTGALQLKGNWLTAADPDGRHWRLITAELRGTSFHVKSTRALVEKLDSLDASLAQKFPGAKTLRNGALFYSNYAATQSANDIAFIGTASLAGILVLLTLFFRSAKPILLTLLSMSVGFIVGALALFLIFGNAHIITLALGTSVIGLSLDYAIHYLTERVFNISADTPFASLKKLLPALSMALATTASAYTILVFAPFPALRQLATFAAFGLSAAFITVILWFPLLSKKFRQYPPPARNLVAAYLRLWLADKRLRIGLPALLALVSIAAIIFVKTDDDIARLQAFPDSFKQTEQRLASLTGQTNSPTFFVVRAGTPQHTLEKLEQLTAKLRQAAAEKKLRDYRSLSDQLPPLATQQKNYAAVTTAYPRIAELLRAEGLPIPENSPYTFTPLTPETWLTSPASRGYRLLWFQHPDSTPGNSPPPATAILPVTNADDPAMRAIAQTLDDTHWINQRAEYSRVFAAHRRELTFFLFATLALVAILFSIRFGIRQGLRNTLPILLAIGTSLAALALSGQALNLFAVLALLLVLGVGVDYTIFLTNPRVHPVTITLSVFLAAITTQLTFGMLALTRTPVIATIGIILATGIATAFLLAPLGQPDPSDRQ